MIFQDSALAPFRIGTNISRREEQCRNAPDFQAAPKD